MNKYRERKNIFIGLPIYDLRWAYTMVSFGRLLNELGHNWAFATETSCYVDVARNRLVEQMLKEKKAQYILFNDPDTIYSPLDIQYLVDTDKDIISGIYVQKGKEHYPVFGEFKGNEIAYAKNWHKDRIIEVDGIGFGLVLIKRNVFEKRSPPWFSREYKGQEIGEDLYFCKKAKDYGFKIYIHSGVELKHVGYKVWKVDDFEKANPGMGKKNSKIITR